MNHCNATLHYCCTSVSTAQCARFISCRLWFTLDSKIKENDFSAMFLFKLYGHKHGGKILRHLNLDRQIEDILLRIKREICKLDLGTQKIGSKMNLTHCT